MPERAQGPKIASERPFNAIERVLQQAARQEWSEDQVLRPICGLRPAVIASLVSVLVSFVV